MREMIFWTLVCLALFGPFFTIMYSQYGYQADLDELVEKLVKDQNIFKKYIGRFLSLFLLRPHRLILSFTSITMLFVAKLGNLL